MSAPAVPAAAPSLSAPAAAPDSAESALMLSAVQALRRDRDAERALVLLEDYLRLYPRGALTEEALALAIEAAAARGDGAAAVGFADEYLQRHPAGRFREAARRAKARFTPEED
jgi:outer membrane protein assembly factor BamD (BamD/ComL family)